LITESIQDAGLIAWHQPLHRGSEKAGNMILEKNGEDRREIGQRRIGQMARVGHPPCWMNLYVRRSVCAGPFCRSAALRDGLRRKEEFFSALYGTAEAVP